MRSSIPATRALRSDGLSRSSNMVAISSSDLPLVSGSQHASAKPAPQNAAKTKKVP